MAAGIRAAMAQLRECGHREDNKICGLALGHVGDHAEVHLRPFKRRGKTRRVEMTWADGATFSADL